MSKVKSSPLTVLRLTFGLFKSEHQQIFYPFITIIFINLLVLEILYFSSRPPLSLFFAPIVNRIWGEEYLHYPMNIILLPKMFYYAQMVFFLFISNIVTVAVIDMVSAINNEKPVNFKHSLGKVLPGYVYIILYSFLSLMFFQFFDSAYGILIHRAVKIHSTTGVLFWLKKSVFFAAPYVQYFYSIFVTALFIYIPVLIVLEKKKFLGAFLTNFKVLFGSFWLTFTLVLIPMLFYLPLLLMRDNISSLIELTFPEINIWVLILSIFVTTGINIFVTAAATTYYLYKKENS